MQSDATQVFIEAWRAMTSRLPSPRFRDANGIASCFADVPNLFFNLWVQSRPASEEDDFRALLIEARARCAEQDNPVGGIVRTDWVPARWETIAAELGLAAILPMVAMETDRLADEPRPDAALSVRRVTNDCDARAAAMINAAAYEMPEELWECISGMHFWPPDTYAFIGCEEDDTPVATTAVMPVEGTAYVAMVATLPDRQGRGYARTVMRHALAQAWPAMGCPLTALHASVPGAPVYAQMGYAKGPQLVLVGDAQPQR